MLNQKTVTTIPATLSYAAEPEARIKKRVAGYARVSTELEEQQSSYMAQIEYYTGFIREHSDWELVRIYTDEGISATNTRHRNGFNSMISDALDGKIDLIITKSVSRFARNTVDSLSTVRRLKDAGIEIYFEKENIWTLDSKGELLITIMSSLAQEESRSISENVTWGHRKRFADGKFSLAYSRFLGYDKGTDGNLVVNEDEAVTIREIYRLYLLGYSLNAIAKRLTSEKVVTPGGNKVWNQSTVRNILTNEKYKGDALLQKTYTVDFLTKKKKRNSGEVPQYYIENNHEPIIDPKTFELAQAERLRRAVRAAEGGRYSGKSVFCGKIKCGDCGRPFGSRVWHSNTKYRKIIYQCSGKYKSLSSCFTGHLYEEEIEGLFLRAMKRVFEQRARILKRLEYKLKTSHKRHGDEEAIKTAAYENMSELLKKMDKPTEKFDENLWGAFVDYITVYSNGNKEIFLKEGTSFILGFGD
ncbi:MAG: recombinase family protein [Oscillospiraceae bacterium]|nr:recombinase family protein [Oscillospiraceae bacterium]